MADPHHHPFASSAGQRSQPIPAVVVGNFRVLYRPQAAFEQVRRKLTQQGFQVEQTTHFLVGFNVGSEQVTLVHQFTLEDIDNNIGYYLMQEVAPCGVLSSDHAFGSAMVGVVSSLAPNHPLDAWRSFLLNTLQRLRERMDACLSEQEQQDTISAFAAVYRRLFSLRVGSSLLDVGCACAFWPVLLAQDQRDKLERIVGVDNRSDAITLSEQLVAVTKVPDLQLIQADLFAVDFVQLGTFDTVTAIHLLEHFSYERLAQAFEQLLRATRRRLIVAVPYEKEPTAAYGHTFVFTREKLEQWGQWCIDTLLGGNGRYWCEDVAGGLLIVERISPIESEDETNSWPIIFKSQQP